MPTPSAAHVEVLTKTLEDVVSKVCLKEEEIQRRRTAVENLEKLVVNKGVCAGYGVGRKIVYSARKNHMHVRKVFNMNIVTLSVKKVGSLRDSSLCRFTVHP